MPGFVVGAAAQAGAVGQADAAVGRVGPQGVVHHGLDPVEAGGDRADVYTELDARFGTPADPLLKVGDDPTYAGDMQTDAATLAAGSTLYRRHCLHCHGVTGDGRGPTAPWVNPPPRDYRRGMFKFTSVVSTPASKPTREDLVGHAARPAYRAVRR